MCSPRPTLPSESPCVEVRLPSRPLSAAEVGREPGTLVPLRRSSPCPRKDVQTSGGLLQEREPHGPHVPGQGLRCSGEHQRSSFVGSFGLREGMPGGDREVGREAGDGSPAGDEARALSGVVSPQAQKRDHTGRRHRLAFGGEAVGVPTWPAQLGL